MDYPNNFDTPAFPAGSRIAISRFMVIVSCILFLLIIFMCITLLWAARSKRIDPFIVSVDEITGEWMVVDHGHGNKPMEYPALWSMQQSVVGNFTENWFTISQNTEQNEKMWQTCERTKFCGNEDIRQYNEKTCALYCLSGEELFSNFIYNIVPDYQNRVSNGERWVIDKTEIQIEPAGQIIDAGGTWRVTATLQSNISGEIDIIAFVKVARKTSSYPQTLGYYVADFNAYKIN